MKKFKDSEVRERVEKIRKMKKKKPVMHDKYTDPRQSLKNKISSNGDTSLGEPGGMY